METHELINGGEALLFSERSEVSCQVREQICHGVNRNSTHLSALGHLLECQIPRHLLRRSAELQDYGGGLLGGIDVGRQDGPCEQILSPMSEWILCFTVWVPRRRIPT